MNEKIKELAERAGIVIIPNSRPISIMGLTTDLEKFAELIVRECLAPPQRPWVGLTSEEVKEIIDKYTIDDHGFDIWCDGLGVVKAVDDKLRSKNT